jgi:superkiller protein 3
VLIATLIGFSYILNQAHLAFAAQQIFPQEAALLQNAEQLRREGNLHQALSVLNTVVAQLNGRQGSDTLLAQVLRETGEIELEQGEPGKAAAAFERSLVHDPAAAVVHYQLGLVYRRLGENRKASEQLQQAIDRGFRNTAALFNQIEAYFESRQSTEAVVRAKELIVASPAPELMLRLGRLLFAHLFYREALNAFRLAHQGEPNSYEARFYLALTHYLLNHYAETLELLTPLKGSAPNAEVLSLLAACQAQLGNYEAAGTTLREAIRREPRSPHPYLNLALVEAEQGHLKQTETLLEQFRALGIEKGTKVFFRVSRNSCGDFTKEVRESRPAVATDPASATFYYQLASQMQESYNHASALQLLRIAHIYEGNSSRLLYAASVSCVNLNPQAPEGVSLLLEVIAQDPRRDDAWHLLGRAYLRQGNFEEAVAALRKALSLERRAAYSISLGKALLSANRNDSEGSWREALRAFEQALALEPDNAMAHYEIGRLLSQAGAFKPARAHLTRAIDLEPDFYEAYYALGHVCSRTGDREQSQKYLALFERKKRTAMEQSIIGSGFVSEGREP